MLKEEEDKNIYRSVYLNSELRTSGTNDEPTFSLNPEIESINKLKVLAVNVPNSYYSFNNLTFIISIGAMPVTATLNGNYTNSQLCATLSSQFTSNSGGISVVVAYDEILGKLTITCPLAFTILNGTANKQLGFIPTTGSTTGDMGVNCLQLTKQFLVLSSNDLVEAVATNSRSYYNNASNSNTIMMIPILYGEGQYSYYENPAPIEYLSSNGKDLSQISFRITDLDGNAISFNGLPFSVKLGIVSNDTY